MSNVITAVSNDNIKSQDDIEKAAVPAPKKQRDKLVEHVEPEADYSMRIAVLGDSGVGKTSLVLKELDELHALDNPVRSIGITFRSKTYHLDGHSYNIQYWDAPGLAMYLKYTARLCAGAVGAILVFDLTDRATFQRLEEWVAELDRNSNNTFKLLVGNKADLAATPADKVQVPSTQPRVTKEEAEEFARRIDAEYVELSAASADQVHQAFTSILKRIVGEIADPPDVNQLMSRSIRLGRNLSSDLNIDYKKRLYQRMLVNPQDLTDKVDWLKPKPSGIGGVGVSISQ